MPEPDDLEALRRRVYAADATAADLARYRAASVRVGTDAPAPSAAPPGSPSLPGPLAVVVVVLTIAAALGVAAVLHAPQPAHRSAGSTVVPVEPGDGARFRAELAAGRDAGLVAFATTRLRVGGHAVEGRGQGSGSLRISVPATAGIGGGTATVLVVLDQDARVRWRAQGLEAAPGGAVIRHALRSRTTDQRAGEPTVDAFAFRDSDRPLRLEVVVPAGVRWGAAVIESR